MVDDLVEAAAGVVVEVAGTLVGAAFDLAVDVAAALVPARKGEAAEQPAEGEPPASS